MTLNRYLRSQILCTKSYLADKLINAVYNRLILHMKRWDNPLMSLKVINSDATIYDSLFDLNYQCLYHVPFLDNTRFI